MANEHQEPKKSGGKQGIGKGGTLFIVGIVGIIISVILFVLSAPAMNDEDPGRMIFGFFGYIVFVFSFCIAGAGAIWWFVVWLEDRRDRKSFDTHDSDSDYNETIKKP